MFILAGGSDSAYPAYWERLAGVVKREAAQPTILSCLFARPEESRPEAAERFSKKFHDLFGEKTKVLFAKEDQFYEQITEADVIYLHGGRTKLLRDAIPDIERFKKAITGKIVIGSSAGANFLSVACFSPSANETMLSSGIVDVGVVVHYGVEQFDDTMLTMKDWRVVVGEMAELTGDRPLMLLPEGEFSIIYAEDKGGALQ